MVTDKMDMLICCFKQMHDSDLSSSNKNDVMDCKKNLSEFIDGLSESDYVDLSFNKHSNKNTNYNIDTLFDMYNSDGIIIGKDCSVSNCVSEECISDNENGDVSFSVSSSSSETDWEAFWEAIVSAVAKEAAEKGIKDALTKIFGKVLGGAAGEVVGDWFDPNELNVGEQEMLSRINSECIGCEACAALGFTGSGCPLGLFDDLY